MIPFYYEATSSASPSSSLLKLPSLFNITFSYHSIFNASNLCLGDFNYLLFAPAEVSNTSWAWSSWGSLGSGNPVNPTGSRVSFISPRPCRSINSWIAIFSRVPFVPLFPGRSLSSLEPWRPDQSSISFRSLCAVYSSLTERTR